jgi:hypothetical protein
MYNDFEVATLQNVGPREFMATKKAFSIEMAS